MAQNKRMENARYWAAELLGWMKEGPNAGIRGTYYVDVVAGKPVLVMDSEHWNRSTVKAIKDALKEYGFPTSTNVVELDDEWRLFIESPPGGRLNTRYHPNWEEFEPTGGDGGDPEAMFKSDQLDTWGVSA